MITLEESMAAIAKREAAEHAAAQERAAAEFAARKKEMLGAVTKQLAESDQPICRILLHQLGKKVQPPIESQTATLVSLEDVRWLSIDQLEWCARVASALAGYRRVVDDESGYVLSGLDRAEARKRMPKPTELTKSIAKTAVDYARAAAALVVAPSSARPDRPDCEFARRFAAIVMLAFLQANGHARDVKLADVHERFEKLDVRLGSKTPFDHNTGRDVFDAIGTALVEQAGDVRVW